VRECVRYRALEQEICCLKQRFARSEVGVERSQRPEEPLRACIPGEWRGVLPLVLSSCQSKRPVHQIAQVGQNLPRCAGVFTRLEVRKSVRNAAQYLGRAVGKCCKRVSEGRSIHEFY